MNPSSRPATPGADQRKRTNIYRLFLFGTCRIEGPDGPLEGRVAQPRQLALLALAGTTPGGMTRDRVGAYLWPENHPSNVRHLVEDVLYILRKSLGKDSLTTVGESIRLDSDRISCDVAEFRTAHPAGHWERMLELYEGPFLDGFYGAGGADFQRWLENERRRCQEVAIRAVDHLVDLSISRGETRHAIAWLRRGRGIDPVDEEITRRLMRLSAQIGNQAEAVRTYDLLRRRLWEELELVPSSETRALLHEIRDGE